MRTPKGSALITIIVASIIAGLALRAEAATLAPSKASQVLAATGSTSTPAACPSLAVAGLKVDKQQNPDGTVTPFNVPAGQVFVVTSWEWFGIGSASSSVLTGLILVDGAATVVGTFGLSTASSDTSGTAGGSIVIPSGYVVKSGFSICYAPVGSFRQVIVHGFFTKDR